MAWNWLTVSVSESLILKSLRVAQVEPRCQLRRPFWLYGFSQRVICRMRAKVGSPLAPFLRSADKTARGMDRFVQVATTPATRAPIGW